MPETLEAAGHQGLVKPKYLRPAVPGGYNLEDFTQRELPRFPVDRGPQNELVRKIPLADEPMVTVAHMASECFQLASSREESILWQTLTVKKSLDYMNYEA
ncbi:hypothetical protein [Arthrobacter livingstonensis]|uniref:hypothetical protein n=1 Tax=Arthrobacter livingstonensis TaxID=670078 RepID=UPI0011B758BB|nr:hypothetical protein [Arthrobacter livingstonensis]